MDPIPSPHPAVAQLPPAMRRPPDALILRGLSFFGFHGALAAERALGQRFVVDMRVNTCLRAPASVDDITHTVSYADVHDVARAIVEDGPPRVLVEKLAADIADAVLTRWPQVDGISVAVMKPHVAVKGVDALGVEIYRGRE